MPGGDLGDRAAKRLDQHVPATVARPPQPLSVDRLARRAAAVDLRVAPALVPAEDAAQVLLHVGRPDPAPVVGAADPQHVRLDEVEQVLAQCGLELGAHQARPQGVHEEDRGAVLVDVVSVPVQAVAARAHPRVHDLEHLLVGPAHAPDHAADPGVHVLAAQVGGGRQVHGAGQLGEVHLAARAARLGEHVVLEDHRVVHGAVAPLGRALAPAGRLLVVPGDDQPAAAPGVDGLRSMRERQAPV